MAPFPTTFPHQFARLGAGATPALVQRYCQLPLKPLPGRGSVSTWLAFSTARLIFS